GPHALFFMLLADGRLIYGIRFAIHIQRYSLDLTLLCLAVLMLGFTSSTSILLRAHAKPMINLSHPDLPEYPYSYMSLTNYGFTHLLYGNTFDAQAISNEVTGKTYRKGEDRYEVAGNTYDTQYDKNLLFPRTYSQKPNHIAFYQDWMNLKEDDT